jgi:hypothetical protein
VRQADTRTAGTPLKVKTPRTRHGVIFAEHLDKSHPTHARAWEDGTLGLLAALEPPHTGKGRGAR